MPSKKACEFYAEDIPNLNGYVVIVTGGNSGIGYETTLQLASHGARVYIAARSPERVNKAIAEMKASRKVKLDLHPLDMDLQNLHSVKEGAETFMRLESRLDVLINNAGIMAVPFKLTTDGFETQWQTNHLAPFFLVKTLLPLLESTAAASTSKSRVRVVNVSSDAALLTAPKTLDLEHPNLEQVTGPMSGWKRYGHSKVASLIHARVLHNRYHSAGISTCSVHPGTVATNLQAADPSLFGSFVRRTVRWGIMPGTISIADGARTTLFCATSPKAENHSGGFFVPYGKLDKRPDKWNLDEELVGRLWTESERMIREAGF